MQNNSQQIEQKPRSSSPPPPPSPPLAPQSTPPYGGNDCKPPLRMQDSPMHTTQQRFALTPRSVGMEDVKPPLTRQQQEYIFQSRSDAVMPQTAYDNLSFEHGLPNEPVIKARSASQAATGTLSQTIPERRRTSAPLATTTRCTQNNSICTPPFSSTQMEYRGACNHAATSIFSPSMPTNERTRGPPNHEHGSSTGLQELTMANHEQYLQKVRSASDLFSGGAAQINDKLNEIFEKRIKDIDALGQGDTSLKLVTYEEWVEMLLRINKSVISNMEELEAEVAERLELVQRRVNCRHSQGNELMKCRKDIDTLIKVIQNAYHYNEWDQQSLVLETVTPAQVFNVPTFSKLEPANNEGAGIQMGTTSDAESSQRNKLLANIKALALEVADKHDEVRELKRQVFCLEDEIQKAQKKIHLKDDVIKELRNDLKRNVKLSSSQSLDGSVVMPPINQESQTARSAATTLASEGQQLSCLDDCESLGHIELLEQQKLKILDDDLNDLFEIYKRCDKQKMDMHRQRLAETLKKSESEKVAAYRKLDYIRRQLIDLENSAETSPSGEGTATDCDSGFSSKNENDQDAIILGAVRKRLRNLNETTSELRQRVQKLESENRELSASSQRNDEIFKDLTELLCNVKTEGLSFTDIYNNSSHSRLNPFSEAIMDMKRTYKQRESQLLQTVGQQNRKIEELMQTIMSNEKGFNERQRLNLSEGEDIDNITPPSSFLGQRQETPTPQQPLPPPPSSLLASQPPFTDSRRQ